MLSPAAEQAPLPPAARAVVVLADGLGHGLLRTRSGHAPFLRGAVAAQDPDLPAVLTAGFPSTTATSMGTFGTGLPPGTHGLAGYQVRVPGTDRLFNELDWIDGPDPVQWQPHPTVFERAAATGIAVTMVGPGKFGGSGLTTAALRGAHFVAARDLPSGVDAAAAAARATRRSLVYLYWGDVDRAGHQHGCESWQWGEAVEHLDGELRRLRALLPPDTSLTVTADHGMVDVADSAKVDVAADRELSVGVELVGGEPRGPQLYCRPGAVADVLATWSERLGDDAWVMTREDAAATGLFGQLAPGVLKRFGDVVVAVRAPIGFVDTRVMNSRIVALIGQHGSLTDVEQQIPFIHLPAQ
ncbi:alkaline phosphatase family protein [Flexivirga caeni]|uniref:Alkaline phosphatase family protein n=2 Tax=Flexivirga caeni TaxID=2294115 RepID=A0A3M9LYP8_9MICO|nr:alkaline phosphatase family protein [Flexivirga caeni]